LTKLYPNNQTHIAEKEVDQSVNGVSSLENAEEPDQKRFKPNEKRNEKISTKIPVQVDTFMFIIFLAGSTKTCSGTWTNMCLFTANMGLGPSLGSWTNMCLFWV
jgi:hypothetical protein